MPSNKKDFDETIYRQRIAEFLENVFNNPSPIAGIIKNYSILTKEEIEFDEAMRDLIKEYKDIDFSKTNLSECKKHANILSKASELVTINRELYDIRNTTTDLSTKKYTIKGLYEQVSKHASMPKQTGLFFEKALNDIGDYLLFEPKDHSKELLLKTCQLSTAAVINYTPKRNSPKKSHTGNF